MSTCPKCGKQSSRVTRFCPKCGFEYPAEVPIVVPEVIVNKPIKSEKLSERERKNRNITIVGAIVVVACLAMAAITWIWF